MSFLGERGGGERKKREGNDDCGSESHSVKKKRINFLARSFRAMPADDSLELFDVVCPSTGEPLLVSDEGGEIAKGPEAQEAEVAGGGDDSVGKGKTSTSSSTTVQTVTRGFAHANGTWHASVYVHLSRARDGAFLLQRRSAAKDVCPALWDLACAEHVSSGETRAGAALRGLAEELGLERVGADRLGPPLGPPRQAVLRTEGPPRPVWDREVTTSYWLRDLGGDGDGAAGVAFDKDEVSEVRWVLPAELKREIAEGPERFTPWFLAELRARPELLLQQGG